MNRNPSPARMYFAFVLVLAGAMLFAAIASPWVQMLLSSDEPPPLHRVFDRLVLFVWIAGTVWLLLRLKLANRAVLGFRSTWQKFLQQSLLGLAAGLAMMALALVPLFLLGLRAWNASFDTSTLLPVVLKGLGTGLLVAMIEETFFRGAMQGALQRAGSTRWALFAVPLLYSAVHFLGKSGRTQDEALNAWSGFTVLQGFFGSFAQPLRIVDAFVALYLVGLLLALVRQRWGNLAGCIGLHAGFVAVITVFRQISVSTQETAWSFLVGHFDGLLGLWIAAVTAVICTVFWWSSRRAA
jgi:uncharacterized protein